MKTYNGNIVTIKLFTGITIANDATVVIAALKPDGTEVTFDATISDTNYISYTTSDTDLDLDGKYIMHAVVNGMYGKAVELEVLPKYSFLG